MIELGQKYGCLTVLDTGEEYKETEMYSDSLAEIKKLQIVLKPYIDAIKEAESKYPNLFKREKTELEINAVSEEEYSVYSNLRTLAWKHTFEIDAHKRIKMKLATHYKCQCKCGQIHYYNQETLETNPKYCFYPIAVANLIYSHSNKAKRANSRKREKYKNIECVKLWEKDPAGGPWYNSLFNKDKAVKDESLPSDIYCELYNKYKITQIEKKEKELQITIASLPRVYADNYDIDFVGKQYETLFIEECVNDHLESDPHKRRGKRIGSIMVRKKYKCRCTNCGKIHYINCDDFGIYPPEEYGYRAYDGYWSKVSCNCHIITSFQWKTCKLLFESNVNYRAEYSFSDLYGCCGQNLLRFDFAVFNNNGAIKALIECQGEQHYRPIKKFGGERQFNQQIKNDALKVDYANNHNIPLICIPYKHKSIEEIEIILKDNQII